MAGLIVWTPDLAVDHEKIDNQHKELFRKFDQVGEAIWDGRGREEVHELMGFLADYTILHFSDEEALMLVNSYPEYQAQKTAHEYFTKEVNEMQRKFDSGEITSELVVSLVNNLGDWFRNHIKKMDKALGQYLRSKA